MVRRPVEPAAAPPGGGVGRRIRSVAATILTVAALAAWFFLLRPHSLGGPAAYVRVSGQSMEPTLHDGDLVITWRRSSYAKGDVIAYRIPGNDVGAGAIVIHRVIGGSEAEGYLTQGDNKPTPDVWRPRTRDVLGRRALLIPRGARVLAFLGRPIPLAFACSFAMFLFVLLGGEKTSRKPRDPSDGIEDDAEPGADDDAPDRGALSA